VPLRHTCCKASRALACELAEDAAAVKLVTRQGLRVRLADRPFKQPLGSRTAGEVWRRQLRWARLRRKLFFAVEIFAGGIPQSLPAPL
jgi:ceramide glucosyltransferase